MRLTMKVTGIQLAGDNRLTVELHGQHGKVQLNLPIDQRVGLAVGSEFTLSLNGPGFAGAIDESVPSIGSLASQPAPIPL